MKNRLGQTESHRPTKYSLRMGLNSGKIREERARLHVTTHERREGTGINRITARIAFSASYNSKYVEVCFQGRIIS
jgi:hypothetical protein